MNFCFIFMLAQLHNLYVTGKQNLFEKKKLCHFERQTISYDKIVSKQTITFVFYGAIHLNERGAF